jgi:hypothetical protein
MVLTVNRGDISLYPFPSVFVLETLVVDGVEFLLLLFINRMPGLN